MTPQRLQQIIAAYGAAPARWPASERAAALELCNTLPESAQWLAEAEQLDRQLDTALTVTPGKTLQDRIAAIATDIPQEPRRPQTAPSHEWRIVVPGLLTLAASFALGFFAGTITPEPLPLTDEPELGMSIYGDDILEDQDS